MKIQELKVKINFIQPILGSMPADEEIYTKYIAEKAPAEWLKDEEIADLPEKDYDRNVTVFPQDDEGIFLYNYHVKGFIKNAGNVLKEQLKIKNLRNKLDDYLFIKERKIYLFRDGEPIIEEDGVLERPLRGMTMQGERIALTASEIINPPAEAEFTIQLVEHKEITMDIIKELLNYGRLQGIGQWRNGGFGQFTWEEI